MTIIQRWLLKRANRLTLDDLASMATTQTVRERISTMNRSHFNKGAADGIITSATLNAEWDSIARASNIMYSIST